MPPKEVARRQKLCSRAMRHLQYAHDKLMALRDQGLALPPEKQQLGKFEFFFFFFRSIQLDWCRFFNIKVTQNTGVFRSCVFLASGMTFWRSIQSFPAFQRSYRMDRDQWTSCGFPAMMMWETTRLRDLLGLNLYMPWRKPCVVERPLVWELLLNKEMLCSWMSWTLKVVKWKQIGACGMQDVVPWNHISDSAQIFLERPNSTNLSKACRDCDSDGVCTAASCSSRFQTAERLWGSPLGGKGASRQKKTWLTPGRRYSWKLPKKGRWVGVSWCILLPLAAHRCAAFCWNFHHLTTKTVF